MQDKHTLRQPAHSSGGCFVRSSVRPLLCAWLMHPHLAVCLNGNGPQRRAGALCRGRPSLTAAEPRQACDAAGCLQTAPPIARAPRAYMQVLEHLVAHSVCRMCFILCQWSQHPVLSPGTICTIRPAQPAQLLLKAL
jgi:hypothetical protein